MNDETKAVETSVEGSVAVAEVPATKKVLFKIFVDANGVEISRTPLTKGRMPKGATKDAEGNTVVHPVVEVAKAAKFYITLDGEGKETSRQEVKQGRRPLGFNLATEGEFAGNYVKLASYVPPVKEKKVKTETVAVTPEAVMPVVIIPETVTLVIPAGVVVAESQILSCEAID